jgi:hypothetical protein
MNPSLEKVWKLLPKFLQDVIATTVDRLSGHRIPGPATADPSKPIRLFISPANYAGQGFRWARAVEGNPSVSARNLVYAEINPFGYDADFAVRWRAATHSRKWQRNQLEALTTEFTHVLIEAEFPPLGGMFHENVSAQVSVLRDRGVSVAMVCHGSDIRLPSRHRERESWSPFVNDDWVTVEKLEKATVRNRELLDEIGAPTFVSTPGLLLDVPYAHFLPVVIDPVPWKTGSKPLRRKRLKVVHIPSNPLVKGTAEILEPLRALNDEGLIEYEQVTGVTHDQMPAIYGDCDIVLDQFRLGDYGVGACEAMASGRLVISHVSEQARDHIASATGLSLPIVEANIDNIGSVIRDVINRPEFYSTIASRGPSFVRRVHDGSFSRAVLEQHFLFPGKPQGIGRGEAA